MVSVDLQNRTHVTGGTISHRWFANEAIGLPRTLWTAIELELEPFLTEAEVDPGEPVETSIALDWIPLPDVSDDALDGVEISSDRFPDLEGSIYLCAAHHWITVRSLRLERQPDGRFRVRGELAVDFSSERVADDEVFVVDGIVDHHETVGGE